MIFKNLRFSAILLAMAWLGGIDALQAQITTWDQLYNAFQIGGNITLTQNITYSGTKGAIVVPSGKNVTLDLNGYTIDRHLDAGSTVLKGNVFRISSNATLTIRDSSKDAENPFGKGIITGGNAGETPDKYGGAIYCEGNLYIYGGTIKGNRSKDSGGAVYLKSGNMMVSGAAFTDNSTPMHGGAIFVYNGASLNISNVGGDDTKTLFLSNIAGACGGGICNEGAMTITGGEFNSNIGQWGGGIYNSKNLNVSGGHFHGNRSSAIQNQDFTLFDLTGNPLFEGNSSDYGAAIQFQSWSSGHANECYIKGGTYRNNQAIGGGALTVRCNPGFINLKISGGLFEENEAVFGGVIDITGGGEVTVTGGSFLNNKAMGSDNNNAEGGVFKNNGKLTISDGVFENNTADFGSCVFQNGMMNLSGNPVFGTNDDVYLRTDKVITKFGDIANTVLVPVAVQDEVIYRDILVTSTNHPVESADLARIDMRLVNANSPVLHAEFTPSDAMTGTPVIELFAILWTDYVTKFADVPENTYLTDGDGNITLKSKEALAWLISVVNGLNEQTANTMSGKTVTLTENVDMAEHIWVAIGLGGNPFKGIFTSNGSTIKGLVTTADYGIPGLFGKVDGGTIKNAFVEGCEFMAAEEGYYGIIADTITSNATVHSSEVMGTIEATNGNAHIGGVVGFAETDTEIHSVISYATLKGFDMGGIVNKLDGSLSNSYAKATFVKKGSEDGKDLAYSGGNSANCYYVQDENYKYKNGETETDFLMPPHHPYQYGETGCTVSGNRMVDIMNDWVNTNGATKYAFWSQPLTIGINDDSPILKFKDFNTMSSKNASSPYLYYGDLDSQINANEYTTMFFYGKKSNSTTSYSGNGLYIDQDAAIINTGDIKAHTNRLIQNPTQSWHLYASPLTDSRIGFYYGTDEQVTYNNEQNPCNVNLMDNGIFPSDTPITSLDLYCFYEPEYHWINLKRNKNSHWHMNATDIQIKYIGNDNQPNENSPETNNSILIPTKGYLVSIDKPSYLRSEGSLSRGDISIPVTSKAGYLNNIQSIPVSEGTELKGYNLLGNPYQSYLSFARFAAEQNNAILFGSATPSFVVYDVNQGGYVPGSSIQSSKGSLAASDEINMHQGFFIVASNEGAATFTNAMRTVTAANENIHFRDEQPTYPLINLKATDSDGESDIAVVEFGRPQTEAAAKMKNIGANGKVYFRHADNDYALLYLSEAVDQLPVWFDAIEGGTYTLTWSTANAEFNYLHLIDNMTGADIDMLTSGHYTFIANTSDYKSRFKMMFSFTSVEENSGTEPVEMFAFLHDNTLTINGKGMLEVIDLNGRIIASKKLTDAHSTISLPHAAIGVYVLKLTDESNVKIQKIIIE